jgi:hypothetical protein
MVLMQHFITRQREQRELDTTRVGLVEMVELMAVVVLLQLLEAVAAAAGLLEMVLKEAGAVALDLVSPMAVEVAKTQCMLVLQLQTFLVDLVAVAVQVRIIIMRQMVAVVEDIQAEAEVEQQ